MISYGPRYFSDSFLDGLVVRKNWDLTKTFWPILKSGAGSRCTSANRCIRCWALVISACNVLWSSCRSIANSLARVDATSRSGCIDMFGWYPLLAKNGDIPVVVLGALLYANSASGRRSDQLSC